MTASFDNKVLNRAHARIAAKNAKRDVWFELRVLRHARRLIADPAAWTPDGHAQDAAGNECDPHEQFAERFSAGGALYRAAFDLTQKPYVAYCLLQRIAKTIYPPTHPDFAGCPSLGEFNASSAGHQGVLALFDKTLAES